MPRVVPALVPLGYGKLVRADKVYALVPLEGPERGDRRRTLVYIEGVSEPVVASRSEGAIARDVAQALSSRRVRTFRDEAEDGGQEPLF